jgi:hypothetical protein
VLTPEIFQKIAAMLADSGSNVRELALRTLNNLLEHG